MKSLTRLSVVFCACNALALTLFAGTESSGKEMKQVAPAPAPECYNWTGLYIGAFGGYKHDAVDTDFLATGSWDTVPVDQDSISSHAPGHLNADGGEVGAVIGYNYASTGSVFGVEPDGGSLS